MKLRRGVLGLTGSFLALALLSSLSGCVVDLKVAVSEGTQNFIFSLLDPSRYFDTTGTD